MMHIFLCRMSKETFEHICTEQGPHLEKYSTHLRCVDFINFSIVVNKN